MNQAGAESPASPVPSSVPRSRGSPEDKPGALPRPGPACSYACGTSLTLKEYKAPARACQSNKRPGGPHSPPWPPALQGAVGQTQHSQPAHLPWPDPCLPLLQLVPKHLLHAPPHPHTFAHALPRPTMPFPILPPTDKSLLIVPSPAHVPLSFGSCSDPFIPPRQG